MGRRGDVRYARGMSAWRVAVLLVSAMGWGCTHRVLEFQNPPPCAAIQRIDRVDSQMRSQTGARGQGLWVGDHVLTAAHVLVPLPRKPELIGEFLLNGAPAQILDSQSGDLKTVATISADLSFTDPDQLLEDWVIVRVSRRARVQAAIVPWLGPINAGDTLYAAGFSPKEAAPELRVIPLQVAEVATSNGRSIDPRLICVRAENGEDLRGWSGAFVGQYDAPADQWRYVGLLMGIVPDAESSTTAFVLRPPAAALDAMMRQEP